MTNPNEFYEQILPLPSVVEIEITLIDTQLQISHFTVNEESRRSGIGKRTMQTIIETAKEYGIETIDANIGYTKKSSSQPQTDPTTQFLQNLGFTITGYTQNTVSAMKRLQPVEANNEH